MEGKRWNSVITWKLGAFVRHKQSKYTWVWKSKHRRRDWKHIDFEIEHWEPERS